MTHEDREHITRDDYSCLSIAVHTYLERELDSYIGHNPCCHGFCLLPPLWTIYSVYGSLVCPKSYVKLLCAEI